MRAVFFSLCLGVGRSQCRGVLEDSGERKINRVKSGEKMGCGWRPRRVTGLE